MSTPLPRAVSAGLVALALVSGCSTATGPPAPATSSASASTSTGTPSDAACRGAAVPAWEHVVWILMENQSDDQVIANAAAPYVNSVASGCGLATSMHAVTHPSLPNYIALTSGSTQGITDDSPPAVHPLAAPSIFSQLGDQGWRALLESMPAPCTRVDGGHYVVRHNPATYYTDQAAACAARDVPLGTTPDLSARFTFIAPDQVHNTHDSTVAAGDAWLASFLPKVLDSPEYRAGTTAVFLTYDEDEDAGGDNSIPALVIAPSTPPGTSVGSPFTHYSLLRTTEEMLGLPLLGEAATAPSMAAAFHLG